MSCAHDQYELLSNFPPGASPLHCMSQILQRLFVSTSSLFPLTHPSHWCLMSRKHLHWLVLVHAIIMKYVTRGFSQPLSWPFSNLSLTLMQNACVFQMITLFLPLPQPWEVFRFKNVVGFLKVKSTEVWGYPWLKFPQFFQSTFGFNYDNMKSYSASSSSSKFPFNCSYPFIALVASAPGKLILAVSPWIHLSLQGNVMFCPQSHFSNRSKKRHWFSTCSTFSCHRGRSDDFQALHIVRVETKSTLNPSWLV